MTAEGKSELFVNLPARADQEKANILKMNSDGMDVEDLMPGLWMELPDLHPDQFVFIFYNGRLPDFSTLGRANFYQSIVPQKKLLATYALEEIKKFGTLAAVADDISLKKVEGFDPYRVFGDVSPELDSDNLQVLTRRRYKGKLDWYRLDASNRGYTFDESLGVTANFGPGVYLEAIDRRPGQMIYYPNKWAIQEEWATLGRIAVYKPSFAQLGIPDRILSPKEVIALAQAKSKISALSDYKHLRSFELDRPWRHYNIRLHPSDSDLPHLILNHEYHAVTVHIPKKILQTLENALDMLRHGDLEDFFSTPGIWVQHSDTRWDFENVDPVLGQKFVRTLFPRTGPRTKERSKSRKVNNLVFQDPSFMGEVDKRIIRLNFDPTGKKDPDTMASFRLGNWSFDDKNFEDVDREGTAGVWIELPDDYLGVYVYFNAYEQLPDFAKENFPRIRVYQELYPAPLLLAELTRDDFIKRRMKTVHELASHVLMVTKADAKPWRVLVEPVPEMMNEDSPIVNLRQMKDGKIKPRWYEGRLAGGLDKIKTHQLLGYLVELVDLRPNIFSFFSGSKDLQIPENVGRVRIYDAHLFLSQTLEKLPDPVAEIQTNDAQDLKNRSVLKWVNQFKIPDSKKSAPTGASPACSKALANPILPQLPPANPNKNNTAN